MSKQLEEWSRRVTIKSKGGIHAEAYIIIGDILACYAKLMITGMDQCLIDTIDTDIAYRRQGLATEIVRTLQSKFSSVVPIGITQDEVSLGFWASLNLTDGLGDERDDRRID